MVKYLVYNTLKLKKIYFASWGIRCSPDKIVMRSSYLKKKKNNFFSLMILTKVSVYKFHKNCIIYLNANKKS